MSCTTQCTVAQDSFAVVPPVRIASFSTNMPFAQPFIPGLSYAPPVPPPIV